MDEARVSQFDVTWNPAGEVMVTLPILPGRPAGARAAVEGRDLVLRRTASQTVRLPGLSDRDLDGLRAVRTALVVEVADVGGAAPDAGAAMVEYMVPLD